MAEYVITDGSRWIMRDRKGKYVPTSCESLADKFSNKLVNQIFNNQLPKALKTTFHVEKVDEAPLNVKQITIEEVHNNTEKVTLSENIQRWLNKIEDLNGLASEVNNRKEELNNELNVIDIILGKRISETMVDEINKAVQGMDKRTYEPRILNELFDF